MTSWLIEVLYGFPGDKQEFDNFAMQSDVLQELYIEEYRGTKHVYDIQEVPQF